jgi:hypothetical protein
MPGYRQTIPRGCSMSTTMYFASNVTRMLDRADAGVSVDGSEPERRNPYGSTTNFAVTLPSTPADQGEQRRTVTNAYSQVAGMHE